MDKEEATRTCSQCHKEVAEANFALHETHCRRFLCLCPDCDEAVPRDQMDQHKEDQHTVVRCSECNTKMERRFLSDHEADECVERLQKCQFCELELRWKELGEHCLACGSRTELCIDCRCYVKLVDRPHHGLTCSATNNALNPPQAAGSSPNNSKAAVKSSTCTAPSLPDNTDEHAKCNAASTQVDEQEDDFSGQATTPQLSSAYNGPSLSNRPRPTCGDARDPNQISTCPHCHLALPIIILPWHAVKCQRYILLK